MKARGFPFAADFDLFCLGLAGGRCACCRIALPSRKRRGRGGKRRSEATLRLALQRTVVGRRKRRAGGRRVR